MKKRMMLIINPMAGRSGYKTGFRVSFSGTSINDYNFHACILQLPICMSLLYHNDSGM